MQDIVCNFSLGFSQVSQLTLNFSNQIGVFQSQLLLADMTVKAV